MEHANASCRYSNRHSLGIVLPGDFRFEEPTTVQYQRALELVNWLLPQLPNCNKVIGHQEVPRYSWKDCPAFSMNQFRTDLKRLQQGDKLSDEEVYWNMKLTKVEQSAVVSMLELWTDGNRHRNPLSKSWLDKAKRGELTSSECNTHSIRS
ncbi:peptidoglycan recognition protein family protein [Halalkalibacterium ligniniphilum]|uniref:peptidoglycan recognition protein family protein n=1 Tax=Halalkalibacterium ligniniphilum TaxID=1134413 RepID=UPI0009DB3062